MMDQHCPSPPSQAAAQYTPKYLWDSDLVLIGSPVFSTPLRGLLLPDAGISGNGPNSSPFMSMMRQHGDGFYSPTVSQAFKHLDAHTGGRGSECGESPTWAFPESSPNTLPVRRDVFPGLQVKVPYDHFAVQVDSMADRTLGNPFPRIYADIPKSYYHMTDESRAITEVVADLGENERSMTEKPQTPMMPFGAKPFLDNCSCTPTCSTSSATRVRMVPQEANQVLQTYNEGEYLANLDLVASAPAPLPKICIPEDRGMGVRKKAKKRYQCGFCCASFSQRQGLTRHSKDKHGPKERCSFCVEFTWSKGRRYVYRRHLQEEHPEVVSPSVQVSAAPITRRGINKKGPHFRQNSIARRTS
ncbi:hypothetical protein BJY52DRAFT_1420864 [Lactarius psammicola]|nr:hypothetical protein BJY52DRAFT_1420864 [Lactarius psammicola]